MNNNTQSRILYCFRCCCRLALNDCLFYFCRESAGSRTYSWAIWDFWFNGSIDCSMKKQPISNPFKSANHRPALKILCLAVANQQCFYSTVQKKCNWNSVSFVLCSRENSTKFRHEISSKRSWILVESNEISHPLKWNFHKAKFCWQWTRVVIKTFCLDRFKPLARVIYLV